MNLILNNIKKTYYNDKDSFNAIKNISFNLLDGEIISVVGKSGCGKSTLLRCLNLIEKPDNGKIVFDNIDITQFLTEGEVLNIVKNNNLWEIDCQKRWEILKNH